jgi:hypothetical protein
MIIVIKQRIKAMYAALILLDVMVILGWDQKKCYLSAGLQSVDPTKAIAN